MMDAELVEAEARAQLNLEMEVDTITELDHAFDWMVATLQRIADAAVPKRTVSTGKGIPWWCPEVQRAQSKAGAARRRYLNARTTNT